MDPKSSEAKTTVEEASNEQEMTTESMEVADSSVKKRKAEEDAADSDDGGDGGTDKTDYSSPDSVPEWGVDSFDGTDYESPEDGMILSDEEAYSKYRRYLRQLYQSKGFELDIENVPDRLFRGYCPIDLDAHFFPPYPTGRDYMEDMVAIALEKYNQLEGTNVECDHIVRAIVRRDTGVVSYITFMAREKPGDEDVVEYQAKTEWKVWNKKIYPIFCRKAHK